MSAEDGRIEEQFEPRRPGRQSATRGWLVLVVTLLGVVVLAVAGRAAGDLVVALLDSVRALGPAGPVLFVVAYAAATVAFVPGSILTLAAGALFGIGSGVVYVFVGATLGSTAAFLVARYLARGWVERRVAGDRRFAAIDRAVGEEGRRIVFLLRLSPIFPYNLLNYALGLTRVRFVDYLIASLGMLPGILLYVYSGRVAGDLARLAAGDAVVRGRGYYAVLALGLAATVWVTLRVAQLARRALSGAAE